MEEHHRPSYDWERIEQSPEFQELVHRRRSFVLPATIFFLAYSGLGSEKAHVDEKVLVEH